MIINKKNISNEMQKKIGLRIKHLRSSIKRDEDDTNKNKYELLPSIDQQKKLADHLNCSEKKIWKFEIGEKMPSTLEMRALSDFFKIPVDYLYFGTLEEYIKLIFTSYKFNRNNNIELGICLNDIKISKIIYHFNLELDALGTNHELIVYPEYQTVIEYAAHQNYLPIIVSSLNITSIDRLYDDSVWGIIADQFCYSDTFIENKKYKKVSNDLTKPFKKNSVPVSKNLITFFILFSSYKECLASKETNYIPFEEIIRYISKFIKSACALIDDTEVTSISETEHLNIASSLHNFNTLNPYHNITKNKSTYCGPNKLKKLYKDNEF